MSHLTLNIHAHTEDYMRGEWIAIDDNTYDGDGSNQIGHGRSKWDAIRDLIEQLQEAEE